MGSTLIEKIIEKNTGLSKVTPGQIVTVNVDRVMIHDIFIPFVAEKFEEMGFTKLWDPDKVVLIYDHLVTTSAVEDVRHFKIGDAFADKYSLTHVHRRDGICHQLMTEAGMQSRVILFLVQIPIQQRMDVSAVFLLVLVTQRWLRYLVQEKCGFVFQKQSK